EISAPTGYDLSQDVVELKVNSNVTVQEDITSGKIIVNKTAEDGIVSNREFKISWTENGIEHSKNAITNDNGIAEFDNLHVYDLGSKSVILYNIAEINTEERYEIPKAQDVTLTGGNADLTVSADFENTLKKGSIKINKQSEDGEDGDRRFTVSGGGQTYTLTTNSEGTAIFADIPVFDSRDNPIVYTVSENDVPEKYVVPAEQTITLEADETVEITFENKLKKFTAEVTKKDSENGKVQGDASLTGAVYGIYCGYELIDEYVTDENGYFKTKEYACGDYTLQEISPSEGYLLDENVYTLGTEPKNYTVEINPISIEVMENIKKGNISIIKHSDANENVVENLEMGAEFEVFLKSAGSYDNAKDYEKDYLITDENGFAQSKNLPYGVYTVRQTKTVNDAEFVSDFDVFIAENGKTYEFILNDAPFKSYIHITKIDSETGKIIPYEGAGFQIFDSENQLVNMGVDTFYTNSEGFLITPETLPYGDYTLVEVQAPIGYVLDKTPVAFSVTAANAEEENAVNIVRVTKSDTAQKGRISVQKKGVIFSSVNENEENYTPIFAERGLENAVFQVIAAEDIITPDGTVRANAGEVVSELVTDENGYAETDLLYLGKYEITEACAPYGYVKNPEIQMVELAYAGQEIEVRDTVNRAFVNDYQEVEITLSKFMEYDEQFAIGNNGEYLSVRFGLFAAEDIIAADGSAIPENGMIAEVSLGEDMTAKFDAQLPFARYYVQEIATDEHYVLNNEKYLVNFEYMGQEMTTVYVDCGQFDNLLKRGKV
ncbi:MAG: Cna B-type domain-containing protein, partial [Oscillospiraceae bacterium]|nr:Cna B-type domain-containing protein [Oscillospiraceae bacterium]